MSAPRGTVIGMVAHSVLLPAVAFALTMILRPAPSIALGARRRLRSVCVRSAMQFDSSTVTLVGTGFVAKEGRLTGTLASGEPIDIGFSAPAGLITLVPEPAHAFPVLTGGLVLAVVLRCRA